MRFLLAVYLVAVLLWEVGTVPAPQVPVKAKDKREVPDQDTDNKVWGAPAVEPPEKDDLLGVLHSEPKQKLVAAQEELPDAKTWATTEDILSPFRISHLDPDLDLDRVYHPLS